MYVSKLCAIIKTKFRDWKCWVSPQNLLKRLIPITPYLSVGWGDVLPPNNTGQWLWMLSAIPIWMIRNLKIYLSQCQCKCQNSVHVTTHDHNPLNRFQHAIVQFLRLPSSVVSPYHQQSVPRKGIIIIWIIHTWDSRMTAPIRKFVPSWN